MPAINFSVFKDKLVKGLKPHTIRKAIPKGWEFGKPLSLYTGMRTKYCHKLVDTFCGEYQKLLINRDEKSVLAIGKLEFESDVNLCDLAIKEIAKNDGFKRVKDFWEYFKDYKEPCYLLHFDMERFTPTQWALESLEKGVLK